MHAYTLRLLEKSSEVCTACEGGATRSPPCFLLCSSYRIAFPLHLCS